MARKRVRDELAVCSEATSPKNSLLHVLTVSEEITTASLQDPRPVGVKASAFSHRTELGN